MSFMDYAKLQTGVAEEAFRVDNVVDKGPESVSKQVDKLWNILGNCSTTVDNSGFSVDNPAGTVYKIRPNLWRTGGFRAPNLWIACG